jgi:omega-6 fatty acid desaturase (delta-12 desaturase)
MERELATDQYRRALWRTPVSDVPLHPTRHPLRDHAGHRSLRGGLFSSPFYPISRLRSLITLYAKKSQHGGRNPARSLVFTSFADWRLSHLRHHASYANLDTRGYGDIWTLTRSEYETASKGMRLAYRLYRHPAVLLGLGALLAFLFRYRVPSKNVTRKERSGVLFTNLAIALIVVIACQTIGWRTYLLIQLPVIWMAGTAGVFLFYVQHQFEGAYWKRRDDWDALTAAMQGCSFYDLPPMLRWFSGSIGYHHVHHQGPRIPNYRLKACLEAIPALRAKPPLTIRQSLAALHLHIWDEQLQQLTPFQ